MHQRLAGRFRGGEIAQGRACAVWLKVDAPELSPGPVGEIQEVSRLGAQGVTSKSKLLAREMPRVCGRGSWVDSEAAKSLKVALRSVRDIDDAKKKVNAGVEHRVLKA